MFGHEVCAADLHLAECLVSDAEAGTHVVASLLNTILREGGLEGGLAESENRLTARVLRQLDFSAGALLVILRLFHGKVCRNSCKHESQDVVENILHHHSHTSRLLYSHGLGTCMVLRICRGGEVEPNDCDHADRRQHQGCQRYAVSSEHSPKLLSQRREVRSRL